ncbi:hypothetical protein RB195_015561 [Necator americanus]|uniref:Receptor L-domain domain-containing protein n=2 Tax=Necator americanus TaxID=51031 RepID=A0ABR1E551_NECAM
MGVSLINDSNLDPFFYMSSRRMLLPIHLLLIFLHESYGLIEKTYPVDDYYIYNAEEKACRMINPLQSDLEKEFRGRGCVHFFGHLRFSSDADHVYEKVQELERITGCVTIIRSNLVHANFPALKEIVHDENFCDVDYALRIIGNSHLKNITFHADFKLPVHKMFFSVNPLLNQTGISPVGLKFDFGSSKDCLQEVAINNEQCRRIVGEVKYRNYLPELFKRDPPVVVHGKLLFEDTNESDLSGIAGAIVVGHGTPAVSIKHNYNLINVDDLLTMKITGREPLLEISGNKKICAPINIRKRVRMLAQKDVHFDGSCLSSCDGGVVDSQFLKEFKEEKECRVIIGDLVISGLSGNISGLEQLKRIERIEEGSLIFQQNLDFESIWFLRNLEVISNPESEEPALQIANNHGLKSLGLSALRTVRSADADKAIEIYTYQEMPISEKKHLMKVAHKREVFNLGHKDIRERRRIREAYQENALLGIMLILLIGVVMGAIAVALIAVIYRRDKGSKSEEERLLGQHGLTVLALEETRTSGEKPRSSTSQETRTSVEKPRTKASQETRTSVEKLRTKASQDTRTLFEKQGSTASQETRTSLEKPGSSASQETRSSLQKLSSISLT